MEIFLNIPMAIITICSIIFGYLNLSVVIWSSNKSKHKLYKIVNILVWLLFFILLFYTYDALNIKVEIKSFIAIMLVFYLIGMLIRWIISRIRKGGLRDTK